ncbi:MAG: hypothetical protein PHE84_12155 [bacterium]|nr:hypothetical protein [bacterium]
MSQTHKWTFFRAGEVDQVVLAKGDDIAHLAELDQKLWVALACPTRGLEFPNRTLDLLDLDQDGRIRVPEILTAVAWAQAVFRNLDDLFEGKALVPLASINDATPEGKGILAGAKRILTNLGKATADTISLEEVADLDKIFSATKLNGDGIVPSDSAEDPATSAAIDDIIKTHGSLPDRSGKPGVNQAIVDKFFGDAKDYLEWLGQAKGADSPGVPAQGTAVAAVKTKVDDYFIRCRMAAFDARAGAALGAPDALLLALSTKNLTVDHPDIAQLPLARIGAGFPLPLADGLNPAWAAKIAALAQDAVLPLLGSRKELSEADWMYIKDKVAAYEAWQAAKPISPVALLPEARIRELAAGNFRQAITDLIASDAALAGESSQIDAVERMCLFRRDLVKLLHNFVNFAEFYKERRGIFQIGTLFIDGRSCDFCLPVNDPAKQAMLGILAKSYLVYCDCTRPSGAKRSIVAALTGGDTDNVMVGRNGVFYDRQGQDWDATVTKIVENPISIRQAFWSPYKSFIRMIEAQVAKRAAAADQEARGKAESTAASAAQIDKTAEKKPEAKKIDVGTVAAIGVAVAGVGAFLSTILGLFFGLGIWIPVGIMGILLMISGPSMLIAWLKLRQRNIGPLLDANGWAVNALAKINIPFGEALTQMACFPQGSNHLLGDPFAEKKKPWGRYLALAAVLALAALWFLGKLDPFLPESVKADRLLGRTPTVQQAPAPTAPAPAPAEPAKK